MIISKALSLLRFNLRVLHQGHPENGKDYSLADLKKLIFFNKVFISNIREMFEKGILSNMANDEERMLLKSLLGAYNTNIMDIRRMLENKITIDKPLTAHLLEAEKLVHDQITAIPIGKQNIREVIEKNHFSGLVFLMYNEDEGVTVAHIDSSHSIFTHPFEYNGPNFGVHMYCNTIDAIVDILSIEYDKIIPIYVTMKNNHIAFIEMEYSPKYASSSMYKKFVAIFQSVVMYSKALYIDDLEQMISENIENPVTEMKGNFTPVNIEDVWDHDILIEYPRDTFNEFLQFISQTTKPGICAKSIYITLYRIGYDATLYNLLINAVNHGVEVYVNIELCASGEHVNKFWYDSLSKNGVHVYCYECGLVKTHSKLALIEFASGNKMAHIGTGNYHTKTTSQYTDLSLITADPTICNYVSEVFKVLMDKNDIPKFSSDFLVTRYNCREELKDLIQKEAAKGKNGLIIIKCNSLDDHEIITQLQQAADEGCEIYLIVRGLCTWCPEQLGKNVTIKSIIWDKLEHSRVYCFGGKGTPKIYIGSLDLVTNKLDKRIETMIRINDPEVLIELTEYLNRYISTTDAWYMKTDGTYLRDEG